MDTYYSESPHEHVVRRVEEERRAHALARATRVLSDLSELIEGLPDTQAKTDALAHCRSLREIL